MKAKSILFLVSLPETPTFDRERTEISACLTELRNQNVVVREEISQEALADAGQFDVVIVVAHYDSGANALALRDRSLSIQDFTDCLPTSFSGIMDLSVCHSVEMVSAIKRRCPLCLVQAALSTVPLLGRILVYPQVAERFLNVEGIDYASAYNDVSKVFHDLLAEMGEENGEAPQMVMLGDSVSKVYAPVGVTRNKPFIIVADFFYDSVNQTVCFAQSDGMLRDEKVTCINLGMDARIDVSLTFADAGEDGIRIVNESGTKGNRIDRGPVRAQFVVKVADDFVGSNLMARVTFSADGEEFYSTFCDISVGDKADCSPAPMSFGTVGLQDEDFYLETYRKLADKKLLGLRNYKEMKNSLLGARTRDEELAKAKGFLARKRFCFDEIEQNTRRVSEAVDEQRGRYRLDDDINMDLLRTLADEIAKSSRKLADIKAEFASQGSGTKHAGDILPSSFSKMEREYLDTTKTLLDIMAQVDVLEGLVELRSELAKDKPSKLEVQLKAYAIAKIMEQYDLDKPLIDPLRKVSKTKHLYWNSQVPGTVLALFIAMTSGCFSLSKKGAQVDKRYRDLLDVESDDSFRRICWMFKRLEADIANGVVRSYRNAAIGRISVPAFFIQKIIISLT